MKKTEKKCCNVRTDPVLRVRTDPVLRVRTDPVLRVLFGVDASPKCSLGSVFLSIASPSHDIVLTPNFKTLQSLSILFSYGSVQRGLSAAIRINWFGEGGR
ncbi:protein of unknown function [Candidatus Nitrotoga arctica]|uniref:Uncharacterized protein n=1 Tax=Candidatus Nitrotoga arctica TaxID=453162 RepID=A0ABM8YWH3_9PROT|nr:protein of unknown function [Candidatus Nitrotoga arctica]